MAQVKYMSCFQECWSWRYCSTEIHLGVKNRWFRRRGSSEIHVVVSKPLLSQAGMDGVKSVLVSPNRYARRRCLSEVHVIVPKRLFWLAWLEWSTCLGVGIVGFGGTPRLLGFAGVVRVKSIMWYQNRVFPSPFFGTA